MQFLEDKSATEAKHARTRTSPSLLDDCMTVLCKLEGRAGKGGGESFIVASHFRRNLHAKRFILSLGWLTRSGMGTKPLNSP